MPSFFVGWDQGLRRYFVQFWPPSSATRELATKIKSLKKGVEVTEYVPFVCVDLKKCVLICGRLGA